ncbi:DUF3667 domain-containing protein [Mesonia sp. K7]|uniref:DUF3667 domain-containing protein n=1 Tax=Mesonia sp. K7 TaxID=2218606 RepID=UPI000DA7D46F|nr:DUF3667 domain-containing protein [Mesonia sp. K7]PZD77624.1 hypothetical protein DNG35_08580 [Mesonia sp. K7]
MENSRLSYKYRGTKCLNCEVPLDKDERYCHYCGQINTTKKLSFKDFFNEFFGSLFSYDSRLYKTLKTLTLRPGQISLEYIKGKRTTYANPFRFYLSVSIIFFIINGLALKFDDSTYENKSSLFQNGEGKIVLKDVALSPESDLDTLAWLDRMWEKGRIYYKYRSENPSLSIPKSLENLNHENNFKNRWIFQRTVAIERISEGSVDFKSYVLSKVPFIIFFSLPVFTLGLLLVYFQSSYTYMEHLVFTFHTQTMLFFLLIINELFMFIFPNSFTTSIFVLIFAFYLFKALRKFYQQGFLKTAFKFIVLNVIFAILAFTITIITLFGSLAVY